MLAHFLFVPTTYRHQKPQDFVYCRRIFYCFFLSICLCDLLSLFHLSFVLASQEGGSLKSPGVSRGSQRYVIDGLSEKSSLVAEPWERLLDILAVAGARCEWQGDKGQR